MMASEDNSVQVADAETVPEPTIVKRLENIGKEIADFTTEEADNAKNHLEAAISWLKHHFSADEANAGSDYVGAVVDAGAADEQPVPAASGDAPQAAADQPDPA